MVDLGSLDRIPDHSLCHGGSNGAFFLEPNQLMPWNTLEIIGASAVVLIVFIAIGVWQGWITIDIGWRD